MTGEATVRQGTGAWFEMVGALMSDAATRSGLSPDLNVSLVERYTDGIELSDGLVQGLRFDIRSGRPLYRVGVQRDEQADILVEVTTKAARELNSLRGPDYEAARERLLNTGEMRVSGDPSSLGGWLDATHDAIVARTGQSRSLLGREAGDSQKPSRT